LRLTKKDTVYQISDKQYLCVLELHSSFYLICTTIAISVVRLDIDHLLTTLTLFSDIGFLALVIERYHFRIIHIIPCTKVIIMINRHSSSKTDYDVKNEPTLKLSQIEVRLSTFIFIYFQGLTRKTYDLDKSVGLWYRLTRKTFDVDKVRYCLSGY